MTAIRTAGAAPRRGTPTASRRVANDDARRAWGAIVDLFTGAEVQRRVGEVAALLGLTPGAIKALITLDGPDAVAGVPMRSLAQRWHCDASHVTQLVDALEGAGLAERRPSPTDRRVRLVALTTKGRRAQAKVLDRLHEPPASFDALTPAQLATVARLLERVAADAAARAAEG